MDCSNSVTDNTNRNGIAVTGLAIQMYLTNYSNSVADNNDLH